MSRDDEKAAPPQTEAERLRDMYQRRDGHAWVSPMTNMSLGSPERSATITRIDMLEAEIKTEQTELDDLNEEYRNLAREINRLSNALQRKKDEAGVLKLYLGDMMGFPK